MPKITAIDPTGPHAGYVWHEQLDRNHPTFIDAICDDLDILGGVTAYVVSGSRLSGVSTTISCLQFRPTIWEQHTWQEQWISCRSSDLCTHDDLVHWIADRLSVGRAGSLRTVVTAFKKAVDTNLALPCVLRIDDTEYLETKGLEAFLRVLSSLLEEYRAEPQGFLAVLIGGNISYEPSLVGEDASEPIEHVWVPRLSEVQVRSLANLLSTGEFAAPHLREEEVRSLWDNTAGDPMFCQYVLGKVQALGRSSAQDRVLHVLEDLTQLRAALRPNMDVLRRVWRTSTDDLLDTVQLGGAEICGRREREALLALGVLIRVGDGYRLRAPALGPLFKDLISASAQPVSEARKLAQFLTDRTGESITELDKSWSGDAQDGLEIMVDLVRRRLTGELTFVYYGIVVGIVNDDCIIRAQAEGVDGEHEIELPRDRLGANEPVKGDVLLYYGANDPLGHRIELRFIERQGLFT